jgi:hypothetical protein
MRTPPISGPPGNWGAILVYAFEKSPGRLSNTFTGRVIHRVPARLILRDGETIDAVRYAGRWWPIYPAETFAEKSRQWVKQGDTVYADGHQTLKLPLRHAYLFDCDSPKSSYD